MPRTVTIIRHAEKPEDESTNPNLDFMGYLRALDFAAFISTNRTPKFIFASTPEKHSARPLLTVLPTAALLGLPVNTKFKDREVEELAHHILVKSRYAGADILICWHHAKIPKLIRALGIDARFKVDERFFDRIFTVHFDGIDPQYTVSLQPYL